MEASAEMRILKDRAEFLRSELDHIQSRIAGLDKHTRPDTE
jgi:predicted  nucleic acid-binding Zn-ribbon protein